MALKKKLKEKKGKSRRAGVRGCIGGTALRKGLEV